MRGLFIVFVFVVFVFVVVTFVGVVRAEELPRGVRRSLKERYVPSAENKFTCLDGSKTIDFHSVNDDFCDCKDSSDEPGTSACPEGTFFCVNSWHIHKIIPSSKVGDGVCDCCDGSDEYMTSSLCVNNCKALGDAYRQEQALKRQRDQEGLSHRKKGIAEGVRVRKDREQEKLVLMERLAEATAELEKLRTRKEEAEEAKKTKMTEYQKQKKEDALQQLQQEHDKLVDEHKRLLEQIQALATSEEDSDTKRDLQDKLHDLYISFRKEKKQRKSGTADAGLCTEGDEHGECHGDDAGGEEDEEDTMELDEDEVNRQEGSDDDEDDNDGEDADDYMQTVSSGKGDDWNHPGYPRDEVSGNIFHRCWGGVTLLLSQIKDFLVHLTLDVITSFREPPTPEAKAREDYEEKLTEKNDIDQKLQRVQKLLEIDLGPEEEFYPLQEQCYEYNFKDYTYVLCPFKKAEQKPKSGSATSLGNWQKWEANYSKQMYTNGAKCWNGPNRSAFVTFECGSETKILSVEEPNKCEYHFVLQTASVCKPPSEPQADPDSDS